MSIGNILITVSCGEPDVSMYTTSIKIGETASFTVILPNEYNWTELTSTNFCILDISEADQ